MNTSLWRRLASAWNSLRAGIASWHEAEDQAGERAAATVWQAAGPLVIAAILGGSATFLLVTGPQQQAQLLADTRAVWKLHVDTQSLEGLLQVLPGVYERQKTRMAELSALSKMLSRANGGRFRAFKGMAGKNEREAAEDLGRMLAFEGMGFDWARDWSRSWANALNAEIDAWNAEEDMVDAMVEHGASAPQSSEAVRIAERKALVLYSYEEQLATSTKSIVSYARSASQESQLEVDTLRFRLEWLKSLFTISRLAILSTLLLLAYLWLRRKSKQLSKRNGKKLIVSP